jgi:ADP-heptose:LPS heptosyltransferase
MKKLKPILWMSFGPIGDTLMMLAFFDDILRYAPDASFTVLTSRNAQVIRDLSAAYPSIRVVEVPARLADLPKFLRLVFSRRWIVLMPGVAHYYSTRLKLFFLLMYIVPGNTTIGFGDIRKRFGWLPFHTVLHFDLSRSVLNNYRRMTPYFLGLPLTDAEPLRVQLALQPPTSFSLKKGTYIVIHMFGNKRRLSLPDRRWRALAIELTKLYPQYNLVFTGSPKDTSAIESISRDIPRTQVLINIPILQVASIINDAALYIGVDTGITHLAGVMKKQSVLIENNSNPLWWPSYNPNARILVNNARCVCVGDNTGHCRVADTDGQMYYRCTYDITDEQVLSAVRESVH